MTLQYNNRGQNGLELFTIEDKSDRMVTRMITMSLKEIRIKNVKEIINMLDEKSINEHHNYIDLLEDTKKQVRKQRVYGETKEKIY